MKTKLLSIFMLLFATMSFAQDVDLLQDLNGDFENGDTLWRFIEIDNGAVVDDLSTLEIVADGDNHYAKWTQKYSANHVEMVFDKWDPLAAPCKADADYTVSFSSYMESGYGTLVVCFGFFDENGGFLGDVKDYTLKNPGDKDAFPPQWQHYEKVVHSPANAVSIYIGFRVYNQLATDYAADDDENTNPEAARWPTEDESPVVVDIDSVKIVGPPANATAIYDTYFNESVEIYPNPANNHIKIVSKSDIQDIHICDMTGKVVKSMDIHTGATAQVDLAGLSAGIYLVKVKSKDGVSVTKVLKR